MYFPAKCRESGRISCPWQLQGQWITVCLRNHLQTQGGKLGIGGVVWCWMASLRRNPEAALPKKRDLSESWKLPTSFLGQCSRNWVETLWGQWSGSMKDTVGQTWGLQENQLLEMGEWVQGLVFLSFFHPAFSRPEHIFFNLILWHFISFAVFSFHVISWFLISLISWNEILTFQINNFNKWRIFMKELSENNGMGLEERKCIKMKLK